MHDSEGTADRSARPYTLTRMLHRIFGTERMLQQILCLFHGSDVLASLACVTYLRPGIRCIRDKNSRPYSTENAMNQAKVMDVATDLHHDSRMGNCTKGPWPIHADDVDLIGAW